MHKFLFMLIIVKLSAQTPLKNSADFTCTGNTIYYHNLIIEYSIGEPITTVLNSNDNSNIVFSGIIQPFLQYANLTIDQELNPDFSIFPNPTKGLINIQGESNNVSNLKLYDYLGSEIHLPFQDNILDLSNLQIGIYTLKVFDLNFKLLNTQKITKI